MRDVDSPWNGSGIAWPDADQVVQALLLAMMIAVAGMLLVGIVEALRARKWRSPRRVGLVARLTLLVILASGIILAIHPLRSISPVFIGTATYLSLILMLEFIVILASDRVRAAFLNEVLIMSKILKLFEGRPAANHTAWSNPMGVVHAHARLETSSPKPESSPVASPSAQAIRATEIHATNSIRSNPRPSTAATRNPAAISLSQGRCFRRSSGGGSASYGLGYREICELRRTIGQVLGSGVLGTLGSELDIKSLCLLVKIDAREDLGRLRMSREFEKLRRLKLVSDRGRLMPRGVRLMKTLKRKGLIEKLREVSV